MPKRKFVRRRFYRKKRTVPRNVKRYVKKELRKDVETKYFDSSLSDFATSYSGWIQPLCNVPQGTTDRSRVGDQLVMRALMLRMHIVMNTGDVTNSVRVIVFQWHPSVALAVPTLSLVLSATYLGTTNAPNAPYTFDYRTNCTILFDRKLVFSNTGDLIKSINQKISLKWAKKKCQYVDASATSVSDQLYLAAVSDSSTATHPLVSSVARLFFDDA